MRHINKKVIGITGGIATGKSTLSNFLKDNGYKVIDADEIAKDLMKKDRISYKKTVEYFGEKILKKDREIDRKLLGKIVFSDPKLLKVLNDITHTNIFQEIKREIEESSEDTVFLDIPLLFEEYENILKWDINFDEIWLVFADRDTQIKRLVGRDRLTKEEAIKRIDSQLAMDEKKERASKVIYNLESIDKLKKEIDFLLKDLS